MENSYMRELVDKLNYYTKLYDEGRPEISDKEWDDMYFELVQLEQKTQEYFEDSPTQCVNYQVVNKLNKKEHNHKMLSLDKTKETDMVSAFVGSNPYLAMAKMDGLTCSLQYKNGKLISAETRGNGLIGEDILHNALQVKSIPNRIDYTEDLIIDGEIVCNFFDFKDFESEYKNPRNFASGSIRLLDSRECAKRKLTFVAWEIIEGFNEYNLLSEKLKKLKSLSFTTVPFIKNENKDISSQIKDIQELSKQNGYPIDGVVFKFDNIQYGKSLGFTDHHFKNAIAYKFYDEEYETTLEDIEWTMGRTGVLTPVAILKPVDIDGTEVSRASLHNVSVMLETVGHAYKGEKVWVYKANMIIPQISRAEIKPLTVSAFRCETCPICGEHTELVNNDGVLLLYCSNPACEGKLINKIEHFFGKKGLDAKGISKATFEKLIDWGWIKTISDVFALKDKEKDWKNKKGFGEKSVDKILQAIDDCRETTTESIIAAAGIPLIGRTVAKDLVKTFSNYRDFRKAVEDFNFYELSGFGYEMNKSIKDFDYSELDYIVKTYLKEKKEEPVKETQELKLQNLTFCVTGKTIIWKNRTELSNFIESLGGKVVGSVSKNTDYLINNDINSTSAKNNKAKELNKPIISEEDFKKIFDI